MIKHGSAPFIECSTKGDRRFSAFCARIDRRGNKSIEEIYQAAKIFEDGSTGLTWKEAKGRTATNIEELKVFYAKLWDEYIEENPRLIAVLCSASGLSDIFGQKNHVCQATELWRIRKEYINDLPIRETGIICFECGQRSGIDCPGRKPDESTRCLVCFNKFMSRIDSIMRENDTLLRRLADS